MVQCCYPLALQTVQLNLFGLSCRDLNSEMYTRTDNLRWTHNNLYLH